MKNILADSTGSRIGRKRAIALLLSFLLFLSIMTIGIATAAADEEPPAEEPPATEEPPAEEPPAEEPPAEEPPAEEPPAEKPPAEEPAAENLPAEEIVKIEGQECVNMQVIVQFKNHVTKGLANNLLSSLNSEVESEITDDGMLLISVPAGEDIESFIAMLSENAYVAFVQPNYVYKLDQTVNDPYAATKQWHLDNINAYEAWDITMGSPSVRVAVLDTGIDLDHPEFSGQIYAQTDVVDDDGNAQDDNGHGTHVAGIIAAAANNEIGVAGVAPNVQLIIVDVSGPSYASTADIIEGLDYAAAHGADVVNISMGGYLNDTALEDEIADTVAGGIVVVAAAGNDATSDTHYPSDYASVIAVTATDMDDEIVPISNFGPQKDLAAPGILIYSTYTNAAGYTSMTGTSMASPMVAGVVALMLSANPDLGVSEVKDILYSTAADLGDPGRDDYYGNGRVDAYAAVAAAAAAYSTQYTVSVQANNAEYGAVSGGGDYAGGAEATVTAEPADGYSFSHWTDGSDTLSTSAQYTFTVTGDVTLTAVFEQSASPTITSSVYPIDRSSGLVKNITVETTIAAFKSKLDNAPESIHIYDKEGDECFEGIVSSGMTVALVVGDTVEDQLTISVLGDISGDGAIDITDILYIRAQITETYTLNACEYAAAEISQDACIDITDILYIRAHVIGNYFITGS